MDAPYTNLHRAIFKILHRANILLYRAAYEKTFHAYFFLISTSTGLQTILLALPWCKNSKYVLRFEIRPREVGEKNRTNIHTYIQKVVDLYIDTSVRAFIMCELT